MKKLVLAAVSAIALASVASAANAAITVLTTEINDLYGTTLAGYGQVMLDDFDAINDARTLYVGNIIDYPGEFEDPVATSAPPPLPGSGVTVGGVTGDVDPTNYASVQGGSSANYVMLGGNTLRGFSFYMGSPDTFNKITFHVLGGPDESFSGEDIWGGTPSGDGNRSNGFRVYYAFGGAKVTGITFESSQNAFEYDGLAGLVPEPATWTMMIMGFGAAGAMLRSRRRALVA
jgi:opacity protein-like surface antigen